MPYIKLRLIYLLTIIYTLNIDVSADVNCELVNILLLF